VYLVGARGSDATPTALEGGSTPKGPMSTLQFDLTALGARWDQNIKVLSLKA
jgi:hypothetical protein